MEKRKPGRPKGSSNLNQKHIIKPDYKDKPLALVWHIHQAHFTPDQLAVVEPYLNYHNHRKSSVVDLFIDAILYKAKEWHHDKTTASRSQ